MVNLNNEVENVTVFDRVASSIYSKRMLESFGLEGAVRVSPLHCNTAEETFEAHAKLADFASEYLLETMGNAGIGSRAAIGVASLPGNAPVEIQLVAAVTN